MFCICVHINIIYGAFDYDKMYENLLTLKNKKLNLRYINRKK